PQGPGQGVASSLGSLLEPPVLPPLPSLMFVAPPVESVPPSVWVPPQPTSDVANRTSHPAQTRSRVLSQSFIAQSSAHYSASSGGRGVACQEVVRTVRLTRSAPRPGARAIRRSISAAPALLHSGSSGPSALSMSFAASERR